MYIFRWLMSHPILSTWILTAIVILLTIGGGGQKGKEVGHATGTESSHETTQAASAVEDAGTADKYENVNNADLKTDVAEQDGTVHMGRPQHAGAIDQAVEEPLEQQIPAAPLSESADLSVAAPVAVEEAGSQQQTVTQDETALAPAETGNSDTESKGVVASMKSAADAASAAVGDVVEQAKNAVVSTAEKAKAAVTGADKIQQSADTVEQGAEAIAVAPQETAQVAFSKTPELEERLVALSSVELLAMARDAFWRDDKDKSAAIYEMLIEREPDSMMYKGELGNVFWHQNRQQESAALYAEVAIPMLKAGKIREVSNMLGFIGAFYPEKARQIHQMMANQ